MTIRNAKRRRRGATTVEFAVVLPLLLLFVFAGLEFSRANMLRNTIANAAFEGARSGIIPGASASDARAAAQGLLDMLQVNDSTISISPTTINNQTETVTVTVTTPMSMANHYVTPKFFLGDSLTASITLPREGVTLSPPTGGGGGDDDDDDD